MDDLDEFRARCRAFLAEDHGDEPFAFQRALYEAGLAGITVPSEYGGQGLGRAHLEAFAEEAAGHRLPLGLFTITLGMCVPVLLLHGTEAQQRRHILPMLRGDELWCQMFSEPNAGSDVAAAQMTATRDGDEWVLDGQKIWTSSAHRAAFGMCIARTDRDVPKHRGLSMFIVPMDAPGVSVRPLRDATGDAGFNEVFCDGARLPAANIIGAPGEGWTVTLSMLMNERVSLGASDNSIVAGHTDGVFDTARRLGRHRDPVVRQALADLYAREEILRYLGLRVRAAASGRAPGPVGSIAKLAGSELVRRASTLALHLHGVGGIAWAPADDAAPAAARAFVHAPSLSIAGGTSEVQRSIIGERVLGLPKEPEVGKGLPFREVPQNRPARRG